MILQNAVIVLLCTYMYKYKYRKGQEMLQTTNSVPLHVQASNYMREKIYNREWNVDEQIPTEHALMDILGMSRGTVKRAIKALVDEGLLVQVRGKGTFVTRPNISHPSGNCLLSFAESLHSQGIDFETQVLGQETIPADEFLAEKLQVPVNAPFFFLKRVRTVDGEPIMYIENRISLLVVPGLDKVDFGKETLFASIEQYAGRRIGYSQARYAAKIAGEKRGTILHVGEEAPVLHLEQQVFLSNNVPVEWGNVWLRANRYVVGTILQRV